VYCSLVHVDPRIYGTPGNALAGTTVSSLHRLKYENEEGAYFIFGDLSCKSEGRFRLEFTLFEIRRESCFHVTSVQSDPFTVYSSKEWPGMSESTALTRSFSEQGVRLRLRKEPRALLRKRGPATDDYEPRHYQTKSRQRRESAELVASPESSDVLRQGEGDQSESPEVPKHPQPTPCQTPNRTHSHQSQASSKGGSYDEVPVKRPRTGSSQSQTPIFSQQNQLLHDQRFSQQMYSDPGQSMLSPFRQQISQQQAYTESFMQSPQGSSRGSYMNPRMQPQMGFGLFDAEIQRQDQDPFLPPQPQAVHVNQSPQQGQFGSHFVAPSPSHTTFVIRTHFEPSQGSMAMPPPPNHDRSGNTPWTPLLDPSLSQRESLGPYPTPNQNLSADSMGGDILTSSAP